MMLVLGLLALKAPFRAPEKSLWVPSRITPLFNSLLKYVPTGYVLKENTRNYRKMLFFGFFGFLAIRAVFETSGGALGPPPKAPWPPKGRIHLQTSNLNHICLIRSRNMLLSMKKTHFSFFWVILGPSRPFLSPPEPFFGWVQLGLSSFCHCISL